MAAETTGFLIDGTVYEVPTLDSLTMGERRVMFELSGVTQEDFVREAEESVEDHDRRVKKVMRHPGFMEALMHVAYQRGNPDAKRAKVALVIEGTNYFDAVATMAAEDEEPEEDAVPLASTSEPSASSSSGSLGNETSMKDSSVSSGNDSRNGSDEPALHPVATTTTRSATSSLSAHEISAA